MSLQQPYVLSLSAAQDAVDLDKSRFINAAFRNSGCAAAWLHRQADVNRPTIGALRARAVKRAFSGELLLMSLCDRLKLEVLIDDLDIPITIAAGGGPRYSEVKRQPAACVLFPLCGASPTIGRVWAIKDGGNACWQNVSCLGEDNGLFAEARRRECSLFIETASDGIESTVKVVGQSWQLASWLALLAVSFSRRADILRLASQWIVTGEVREAEILGVKIDNKPKISVNREWMIPRANALNYRLQLGAVADSATKELRFHSPLTLGEAYSLGCGMMAVQLAKSEGPPRSIDELHVFMTDDMASSPCQSSLRPRRFIRHQFQKKAFLDEIGRCSDILRDLSQHASTRSIWVDITQLPWPAQAAIEVQVRTSNIKLLWHDAVHQMPCKYWYDDYLPKICTLNLPKSYKDGDLTRDLTSFNESVTS